MNNLIVAIDDVHPEKGWGVEGDVQVQYLENLNHNFGVKFNLFIPSNYHNKFPITKEFVDFWKQQYIDKDLIYLEDLKWFNSDKIGWSDDRWRP